MANGLFSTWRGKPLNIFELTIEKIMAKCRQSLGFNFEDDLWLIENSDEVKKKNAIIDL